MSLNASSGANVATAAVQAQIDKLLAEMPIKSNADIAKDLAAAYHGYAQQATLPGADCSAGGTLALLEAAFITDNSGLVPGNIAQGICDYWSSITATGAPAHGGTAVVSVAINGGAVLASMVAAITGVITTAAVPDAWLAFYQATESVVKTIPCTITELMPPSGTPTPFAEVIG